MGVDFIEKRKGDFKKGVDRSSVDLSTPKLLFREADNRPRTYQATILDEKTLRKDEEIFVLLKKGNTVVATTGFETVAVFDSPSNDLINALHASHGEALGTVRIVHEVAMVAEIEVS